MFFCFNIFMVIFYICFKLKNKFFDYIISSIFFFLFIFTFINFESVRFQKYTFNYLTGELLGFKYLHMFIIKYFMGVLGGLYYFYSNETILQNTIISSSSYLPFSYIFDYLIFIDIKRNLNENNFFSYPLIRCTKIIIFFLSLLVQILLIYFFVIKIYFNNQEILLDFTIDLKIYYFYERYIYGFAFLIMISYLSLSKNNFIFKNVTESKLFMLIGRFNLTYFCIIDTVIYTFFAV